MHKNSSERQGENLETLKFQRKKREKYKISQKKMHKNKEILGKRKDCHKKWIKNRMTSFENRTISLNMVENAHLLHENANYADRSFVIIVP